MVSIKKQLVSESVINSHSYGRGNTCKYIVIHETANYSKGANAKMHALLQSNGNSRDASWHYQVDEHGAIQSFPDTVRCWHAGSSYNNNSIGIEICVNDDGDFKKSVENAAELTKKLMVEHNVSASNVITHHDVSTWGKDCPHYLRSGVKGVTWNDFKEMLSGKPTMTVKPEKPKTKPSTTVNGSVVDYLKAKGQDSSFNARKKLADAYGVKNYTGTAKQNTELLAKLKKGKPTPKKKDPKKSSSGYKGNSIVDYLNSLKLDASYSNRAKLAKKYGISGYKGTAAQNKKLLDKMRSGSKLSPKNKGDMKTSSVVDYLKSIGESSSFSHREKLAAKYGIKGYKGTASQNSKLLNKLRG